MTASIGKSLTPYRPTARRATSWSSSPFLLRLTSIAP